MEFDIDKLEKKTFDTNQLANEYLHAVLYVF